MGSLAPPGCPWGPVRGEEEGVLVPGQQVRILSHLSPVSPLREMSSKGWASLQKDRI